MLSEVNEVQNDIYRIFSDLIERRGLRRVYDEGTNSFDETMNSMLRESHQMLERERSRLNKEMGHETSNRRDSFDIGSFVLKEYQNALDRYEGMLKEGLEPKLATQVKNEMKNVRERMEEAKKEIAELKEMEAKIEESRRHIYEIMGRYDKDAEELKTRKEKTHGAAARLFNEDKIDLAAAEKYEAQLRAAIAESKEFIAYLDALKQGKNPDYKIPQEVTEMREDVLLDIVSRNNDPAAVCVYGAAHDWTNNVIAWNSTHPNDMFSLIVVTPKAYVRQEVLKALKKSPIIAQN
jgi:hypothetical protein